MSKQNEIREELKYDNLIIQLYQPMKWSEVPYKSISNINAFDLNGILQWQAERPKTHGDTYVSIKIDSVRNLLIANSAVSFRYLIDLRNGKIVDYHLLK